MRQWKRIVVGVDGSPASRAALEWAGDEAVRHGSELVVLTAWLPVPPPYLSGFLCWGLLAVSGCCALSGVK